MTFFKKENHYINAGLCTERDSWQNSFNYLKKNVFCLLFRVSIMPIVLVCWLIQSNSEASVNIGTVPC